MTEQTPTPPPAPPAPPVEDTRGGRGGGGRRKLIIGGLAAALVLGGGYGAYAVYDRLDGGGAQPHDVLPASSDFYVRLDLDPSASQKIDLFRLLRKVPDLADEVGIKSDKQDIRKLVFGEILASECEDLDYDKDVEPWLGDRLGVGGDIEKKQFLVAVQTTDEDASRAGIKRLFECAGDDYGIAYLDGYAILAPEQDDVDAAITATKKSSLADNETFAKDFDQLGEQGIASGWADLEAIAKLPEVAEALGGESAEMAKAGSVATTLRADGSAIELAVLSGATNNSSDDAVDLADLPADTVAALSIAGVGDQVTEAFDSFVEQFDGAFGGFPAASAATATPEPVTPEPTPGPTGAQGFIDEIEAATGLQLPEDLATLFGDSLTLAIGSENLETLPTLSGPAGLTDLDIVLALDGEEAAALDLVQRIAQLAGDNGIPLVADATDDGAVLATNQGAADAISDPDGSLGDEDVFRSVIPDGDSSFGGAYVDIGTILDKILKADPPQDVRTGIESASNLSAFGLSTSTQDDDRTLSRVRVSFR